MALLPRTVGSMFCCLQGTIEGGESRPTGPNDSLQHTHIHSTPRTSQQVVQEEINLDHTKLICTTWSPCCLSLQNLGRKGVSLAPLYTPGLFSFSPLFPIDLHPKYWINCLRSSPTASPTFSQQTCKNLNKSCLELGLQDQNYLGTFGLNELLR